MSISQRQAFPPDSFSMLPVHVARCHRNQDEQISAQRRLSMSVCELLCVMVSVDASINARFGFKERLFDDECAVNSSASIGTFQATSLRAAS